MQARYQFYKHMKKQLLLFVSIITSISVFGQTYDDLPAGYKPYGTQYYKNAAGTVILGTSSGQFRVITNKFSLDSLTSAVNAQLALKLNLTGGTLTGDLHGVKYLIGDTNRTRVLIVKGTSVTKAVGYGGITDAKQGWLYLLSKKLGVNYVNAGVGGRSVGPFVNPGSSFYNSRFTVPAYTPGSYYFLDCMINDVILSDTTTYTPAIYALYLSDVVDPIIAAGWPANHIILGNLAYYNPPTSLSYPNVEYRQSLFYTALLGVVTAKGTLTYNGYNTFKTAYLLDNTLLAADITHPTAKGDSVVAVQINDYLKTIITPIEINNTKVYASGKMEIAGNSTISQSLTVGDDLTVGGIVTSTENDNEGFQIKASNVRFTGNKIAIGSTYSSAVNAYFSAPVTGSTGPSMIYADGQIQTQATQAAYGYRSRIGLAASASPLVFNDIYLQGGTNDAGSSFVSKYGVRVINAWATGTTLNSAFTGEINAATGKKNLDMTGTANNYLNGNLGLKVPTPLAYLHIGAGSTTLTPEIKTSGPLNTTPVIGAEEFLTDKRYFVITTGAARKEYALNDVAITPNRLLVSTTSGRHRPLAAVDTIEAGYLDGTTSNIQSQLNAKADISSLPTSVISKYTPTVTITGGASLATGNVVFYDRRGSYVTVTGRADVTASGPYVDLTIPLPIASNFTSDSDLAGVVSGLGLSGYAVANSATDDVRISYKVDATGTPLTVMFSFKYEIK